MHRAIIIGGGLLIGAASGPPSLATPPEYTSFERAQKASHAPDPNKLLRIWMINIGQGDAMLVQLPRAHDEQGQRTDILVDGGPKGQQLAVFLHQLYGEGGTRIEHAVVSHHDSDHVAGLTSALARPEFGFPRIYHNGLVSWLPSVKGFQGLSQSDTAKAVFSAKDDGRIDRGMGFLKPGTHELRDDYLISDLYALKSAHAASQLHSVYKAFAEAIVDKTQPETVQGFDRVDSGSSVLPQFPAKAGAAAITLQALWPSRPPVRYGSGRNYWSYSINGNSVTFRLTYGEFQMLFTGDHNDDSEQVMLDSMEDLDLLHADVLKVPHHGSAHSLKSFFDAVSPVVSVASMGKNSYGHPSAKVVSWAGGAHRIYHTHIHERKFPDEKLSAAAKEALIEGTHILIETDGQWFRVVETRDPRVVPDVADVRRGDGTRWISAQ